jgi:hypothetical protein
LELVLLVLDRVLLLVVVSLLRLWGRLLLVLLVLPEVSVVRVPISWPHKDVVFQRHLK